MNNEEEDPKTMNLSEATEGLDFNRLNSENPSKQKEKLIKEIIFFSGIILLLITTIIIIIIVIVSLIKVMRQIQIIVQEKSYVNIIFKIFHKK